MAWVWFEFGLALVWVWVWVGFEWHTPAEWGASYQPRAAGATTCGVRALFCVPARHAVGHRCSPARDIKPRRCRRSRAQVTDGFGALSLTYTMYQFGVACYSDVPEFIGPYHIYMNLGPGFAAYMFCAATATCVVRGGSPRDEKTQHTTMTEASSGPARGGVLRSATTAARARGEREQKHRDKSRLVRDGVFCTARRERRHAAASCATSRSAPRGLPHSARSCAPRERRGNAFEGVSVRRDATPRRRATAS